MKKVCLLLFAILTVSAAGQTSEFATATRATNGKLISLTNIVGLSDCETRNFVGEVRKIEIDGNVVRFQLWARNEDQGPIQKIKETITGRKKTKERQKIKVDLNRIAPADRAVIFKDMIRKSFTLRVAGYSCASEDDVSVFSIDLVY